MQRILLTGFRRFANLEVNPTERLMEQVAALPGAFGGAEVHTAVLDVDYVRCEEQFVQAVEGARPEAVIAFGVYLGADDLRLERIAVNVDEASIPDTAGLRRSGQRIVEDGPVGYWSTLPLEEMQRALRHAGLAAVLSNHAGTYMCNHIFYYGRHWFETRGLAVPVGFVHVPPLPEGLPTGESRQQGMALETLLQAAHLCVATVADYLRNSIRKAT
jgi:pyroglutamyl-peptidase